ncbi:MAG TPA: PD-(D/E)XK nuclease family protein [Myxococcota bacterium]|nr:PD-(D/E)XK nuclease family protein [Myxococcota bacterium]
MPEIVVARGARATEDRLLRDLAVCVPSGETAVQGLGLPVRIVVPSRSLRDHLGSLIVRQAGHAVAGIAIHTLHGLAREVLERAGVRAPVGEELLPVLASRCARSEPELRAGLEPLQDGYAALLGTITDLLDAGFDAIHASSLDDALCEFASRREGGTHNGTSMARMRALVRVAACTAQELARLGLGRASTRLQLAREAIERDAERALPGRAVLVHGFADATGEASALIEALCRHRDATVYMDHPPDPANPSQADFGVRFTQRLRERLLGTAKLREDVHPAPARPEIQTLRAGDAQSEVRAVADRVRRLLDGPEPPRPEEIGIVARTLGPYAFALRLHLERLGIPFSSPTSQAPPGPGRRRVDALLELLRRREATTAERWLEARADLTPEWRCDLRTAFHALGVARLGDVARLVPGRDLDLQRGRPLPVHRGLELRPSSHSVDETPHASVAPRVVSSDALRAAVEAAARLCRRFAARLPTAPLATHVSEIRALMREDLGFPFALVAETLRKLELALPPDFVLTADEFLSVFEGALAAGLSQPFGGAGAGVQVLDAIAARGRTFAHLFVLGMNREAFPRIVQDDPFLPDAVRRALLPVLPDLALKETGFVEERYLFAQLLSASVHVTLSWQLADDDGKPRAPSPLVQRMHAKLGEGDAELVPAIHAPPREGDPSLRSAHEYAILAGLHGNPEGYAGVLPIAIEEGHGTGLRVDGARLGAARIAILRELDLRFHPHARTQGSPLLGPYFGFLGAVHESADPRGRPLYVTAAEQLTACPWQLFVQRLLRIQAPPDALGALPGIDPRLVGATVHAALEQLAVSRNVPAHVSLEAALSMPSTALSWPEENELERILHAAAEGICKEEGIALPGYAQALVAMATPCVREAQHAEGGRTPPVLGVEVEGACEVRDANGRLRSVRFRADRVDDAHGALLLTDYKVGRPISTLKTADRRDRDFLRAVRSGERLQAMAYALAAAQRGRAPAQARGRYLFLTEDLEVREFAVRADNFEFADAFRQALNVGFAALDAGSFLPRLVGPDGIEPKRCERCEVHQACLRGDSGARHRLEDWVTLQSDSAPASSSAAEQAAFALWQLKDEAGA